MECERWIKEGRSEPGSSPLIKTQKNMVCLSCRLTFSIHGGIFVLNDIYDFQQESS